MELSGLQIFKYLPAGKKLENANCKKCGCPTCMAFALKLAKGNIELDKCPNISEESGEVVLYGFQREVYYHNSNISDQEHLHNH